MDSAQQQRGSRPLWRRVLNGGVIVAAVFAVVPLAFAACGCREGPGSSELSRDLKLAVSTYYRACRGEPVSMEVSITSGDSLPYGPGNVFSVALVGAVAETWPILAIWTDSGLDVHYDPRVQIRTKRSEINGIRIIYRPDTNPPRRPTGQH